MSPYMGCFNSLSGSDLFPQIMNFPAQSLRKFRLHYLYKNVTMQTRKKQAPTRTIALRLPAKEYEIFDKICKKLGRSKSSYLRMLIMRLNRKLEGDLENE